jgi:hypothetical protein
MFLGVGVFLNSLDDLGGVERDAGYWILDAGCVGVRGECGVSVGWE